MPKSKTRTQKKTPVKPQNPPIVSSQQLTRAQKTYGTAFKEILLDPKFMIPLGLISIAVGITMQINWVQIKCPSEPFFGSTVTICKDNKLRLILGGPLAWIITSFFAVWLKKNLSERANSKILRFFALLLPLLYLPFVHGEPAKNKLTALTLLVFFGAIIYAKRERVKVILKSVFAKPSFNVSTSSENGVFAITVAGSLQLDEKDWIYESLLDILAETANPESEIRVDISQLDGYDNNFSFIFHLFAAFGAYTGRKIVLNGTKELIVEINKSLDSKFESSFFGQ